MTTTVGIGIDKIRNCDNQQIKNNLSCFLQSNISLILPIIMRLHISTFNCAKSTNHPKFFENLPSSLSSNNQAVVPDFFIFGFQEISTLLECCYEDLIKAILSDYSRKLKDALNDHYNGSKIEVIGIESIGGIGIILLTSISQRLQFTLDYSSSSVNVGRFNSSLKAVVGVRIKYNNEYYTFISCHLTANEGYASKRDEDFWTIVKFLRFDEDDNSLFRNDGHVFILGDLNYRVDPLSKGISDPLNYTDSQELIDAFRFDKDELIQSIQSQRSFVNFTESKINFPPTYKFKPHTKIYKENRTPSWCDRILYQNYPAGTINVLKYESFKSVDCSDHEPVFLQLEVNSLPIPVLNEDGDLETIVDSTDESREPNTGLLNRKIISLKSDDYQRLWLSGSGYVVDYSIWVGLSLWDLDSTLKAIITGGALFLVWFLWFLS